LFQKKQLFCFVAEGCPLFFKKQITFYIPNLRTKKSIGLFFFRPIGRKGKNKEISFLKNAV
jgi:hypothetical protein